MGKIGCGILRTSRIIIRCARLTSDVPYMSRSIRIPWMKARSRSTASANRKSPKLAHTHMYASGSVSHPLSGAVQPSAIAATTPTARWGGGRGGWRWSIQKIGM